MRFRPCIDIHQGKVKQIVGGSLGGTVEENHVSERGAAWFAELYRQDRLPGGHVILLDRRGTEEYEASWQQARQAFLTFPGGLMAGGGIGPENAAEFLDAGASHVIVTSYVFREGRFDRERLAEMVRAVGRERLVVDLSCRWCEEEGAFLVVTDRWTRFTREALVPELLEEIADSAAELLVHAVDVEGKQQGIEEKVVTLLGTACPIPAVYAGGVRSMEDLDRVRTAGRDRVDVTIGSALDLFGGALAYRKVKEYFSQE